MSPVESERLSGPRDGAFTRKNAARRLARQWNSRDSNTRAGTGGDAASAEPISRRVPIGLSSSSVFPLGLERCFQAALESGYDGVEVMCSIGAQTRDARALRALSKTYEQPILSLHAPTLFFLQFVGGLDPFAKLEATMRLAAELGVPTVVAHPPFRWQGDYARHFVDHVCILEDKYAVELAVENMYPWRLGVREALPYFPDHDPTDEDYRHVTIDLSHAATAGDDALSMVKRVGDRLAHLHLTDGNGRTFKDEHLVPGEGTQPAAEILRLLAARAWYGSIVVEISTGGGRSLAAKMPAIRRSLEFARRELGHDMK